MPTCTQFIRKTDKEAEKIVVLDEQICAFLGWCCDDEYAFGHDAIAMIGIGVLTRFGGSDVTQETLNQYIAMRRQRTINEVGDVEWLEKEIPAWQKFLVDDYVFTAWRSFK